MIKTVIVSQGFISSYLIKRLKELKHQVIVYHHGDKMDFTGVDYIFYTSSYGNHYHQKDQNTIFKSNIFDYIKILRDTINIPYRALFYFSSSSVTLPVQTDYSDAKYIGEIMSKRFFKKFNKPIISIRPSSVYGEGEADFRFIPTLVKKYKKGEDMPLTEGHHDWIYMSDFIDALILIMKNSFKLAGKSIAIGTGVSVSNTKIFDLMGKIAGKKIKEFESPNVKRVYDTKNWVADATLIKSLGWKQKVSLEEGLKKTFNFYKI